MNVAASAYGPLPQLSRTGINVEQLSAGPVKREEGNLKHERSPDDTMIQVGNSTFSVPLSSVPYLSSFVGAEKLRVPPNALIVHDHIPLFEEALIGIKKGYRQCFRLVDADIGKFKTLCETYKFLGIDVTDGQGIDGIASNIKAGKPFFLNEGEGDKSLARDSAFRFVSFLFSSGDRPMDANKIYNTVSYIASHPATFKYRTRHIVQAIYEHQLRPTAKQLAGLSEWNNKFDQNESDHTTESYVSDWFSSDDDSFWL